MCIQIVEVVTCEYRSWKLLHLLHVYIHRAEVVASVYTCQRSGNDFHPISVLTLKTWDVLT